MVTAWVPFRMAELQPALAMLGQMYNPAHLPVDLYAYVKLQVVEVGKLINMVTVFYPSALHPFSKLDLSAAWLTLVALVVFFMPNVYQLFERQALAVTLYGEGPKLAASRYRWSTTVWWASATSLLLGVAVMQLGKISPFLYFQF